MKKKRVQSKVAASICLLLCILFAFSLTGCAPSQTPDPASAPETDPETESPDDVIELKFATWVAEVSHIGQFWKRYGEMIEEKSEGRVKINYYWSQGLVPMPDGKRAAQSGITDIATIIVNFTNEEPLHGLMLLPMMGINPLSVPSIYKELTNQFPELMEEFPGTKVIGAYCMAPSFIHTIKDEIRVPADMKGKKIICSGLNTDVVVNAGGVPIALGGPDWYTSLERGMAQGQITGFPQANVESCLELETVHNMFDGNGLVIGMVALLINNDNWNSLPADIQEIFNEMSVWFAEEGTKVDLQESDSLVAEYKEKGHTYIYLNPEEMELWSDVVQPIHNKWIEEYSSAGPTQAIYDEIKRLVAENK